MALSKKPYKGCRDLFPENKRTQNYLFEMMKKTASLHGYEPYDGPMLEEVSLYRAKSGQELINEQIYSFHDRGDREVAIRPEMTPTVARMVAQVYREIPKPIRWYSIPNLMRYERPQKGRLREHWQFNVDIFGDNSIYMELEVLQVAVDLFEQFGANQNHFEIKINNRKLIDHFFSSSLSLNEDQSLKLYKLLDRVKKIKPEAFKEELAAFNLSGKTSELFSDYLKIGSHKELEDFLEKIEFPIEKWDYRSFFKVVNELGLSDYILYDPTIVRGLDYYTGLVFEIFDKHPDNRRALCGGGAYEGLMSIFGEDQLPGVGFGLGDVTLKDFLEVHKLLPSFTQQAPSVFIASESEGLASSVMKAARFLRKENLNTIHELSKLKYKKIFQNANKMGAKNVIILQLNDSEKIQLKVKNMASGEQKVFTMEGLEECSNFCQQ